MSLLAVLVVAAIVCRRLGQFELLTGVGAVAGTVTASFRSPVRGRHRARMAWLEHRFAEGQLGRS
jgi:hypothetical protein